LNLGEIGKYSRDKELVKSGDLVYTKAVYLMFSVGRRTPMEQISFPKCQKCNSGELVPLSDFGSQGASIQYKAWVCTNPDCGFNLKIRNGDVYINEPIMSGSLHNARSR
jgi:hypothetical protein